MPNGSSSHTPGPWNASGPLLRDDTIPVRATADTGGTIYIANVKEGTREGEREANAQLIAAAPELRAALSDLVRAYDGEDFSIADCVREGRLALARAEGRS